MVGVLSCCHEWKCVALVVHIEFHKENSYASFVCGPDRKLFKIHKEVLIARSEYFKKMLSSKTSTIVLPDVTKELFWVSDIYIAVLR